MPDLLIQAMSAKQSGNTNLAKQLLSQAIIQDPQNEAAWMLMAEVVDDVQIRRNCLEKVLAINPDNAAANLELTKLNTSPLGPIIRGERNKPLETPKEAPKAEKTPPFTPPFTWDEKPEQYLALGDLTFPDLTDEEESQIPETPPTFDWANESEEPDKTMDKIFEAVSKPELASEPPPQKEVNWLDELRPSDDILETPVQAQKVETKKVEDPWLEELVGSEAEIAQEQHPLTEDDFSVSAEPELGLQAFATSEAAPAAPPEGDSLLWDNPNAQVDRLVILSYHSLIYANPEETDIPQIIELFNENRLVRDLLGKNAHMIKLESIERVIVNPKAANMIIEYNLNGKTTTHQLIFSTSGVRDEALTALQFRLGAGYKQIIHSVSLEDKILSPIIILVLLAALTWGLIWGVPLMSTLPGFDTGSPQVFFSSLMQLIGRIGSLWIILLAGVIAAACVVWMVLNLKKPSSEVILQR
jgi:hypothetical protein